MKLISLFVLAAMAVSTNAWAQTTDPIQKALLAAPNEAAAKDATVIRWKPDQTYDTLKQGTSRMVCYDLTGMPGERPFSVECTSSVGNLPRAAQNRKLQAMAAGDEKKLEELVMAAGKDGSRVKAEIGSVWYNFRGADEARATRHTTVAMPGYTGKQLGLPEDREQGGAWLMFTGTTEAHIMVPGR